MKKLIPFLKSPFKVFVFLLLLSSLLKLGDTDKLQQYIQSDGRGYYAYLPAIFIFNDPTFEKSVQAEIENAAWKDSPLYLYPSEDGGVYNKYFPGVAILQVPFFGLACASAYISNSPIDGYSNLFHAWYFIGSVFYALLGLLFFRRLLKKLYPDKLKAIDWWIPILFVSTTMLFYAFETPSFTHHYSFFLFSAASVVGLNLAQTFSWKKLFLLGVLFGLIFLVRPTNILFLFFLPFLFPSKESFFQFFRQLFLNKAKGLTSFILGFGLIGFLLLFVWKWESGSWILWSYSGEGFNFLSPKIWQNLFGWRVGLFIHTPLFILSIFGLNALYKRSGFHAIVWLLYFGAVLFVISSWWCWDYESSFGNRPFTEHIAFLLIPVFIWLAQSKSKLILGFVAICALVGGIRLYEKTEGILNDQRFVSGVDYFSSLAFWRAQTANRYNFGRSCPPLGKMEKDYVLFSQNGVVSVQESDLYSIGGDAHLPTIQSNERYFYQAKMDKWQSNDDYNEVYLVLDAFSNDSTKRYYKSIPLFHDRFKAKGEWDIISFSGMIEDNFKVYQHVKMYIWNPGKKKFKLKNVSITLEKYVH